MMPTTEHGLQARLDAVYEAFRRAVQERERLEGRITRLWIALLIALAGDLTLFGILVVSWRLGQ